MRRSHSQSVGLLNRREAQAIIKVAERLLHKSRSRNDRRAAVVLIEAAALAGVRWAAWKAGYCWESGIGVRRNRSRAKQWYRRGVRIGDEACMANLGVMEWDSGNKRVAIALYRRAAALGEENAQHNLGLVFQERGRSRDLRHAFELFTVSGNNGHPNAAYRAACCYFYGEGTRKNMARSLAWFEKAARLGSARAKRYLKSLGTRARWAP